MKNNKAKISEEKWANIRIRVLTLKRLRLLKPQMEVPLYDDVINFGLNKVQEEMDDSFSHSTKSKEEKHNG